MWLSSIALGIVLGIGGIFPLTLLALFATLVFSIALPHSLRSAKFGYLALFIVGIAFHTVNYYWIPSVLGHFHRCTPAWCGSFAAVLFIVFSFQFPFFLFVYRQLSRTALSRHFLALPIAWIVAEELFPKIIPWRLGNPWIISPPVAQWGEFGGPVVVSFLVLWWGSSLVGLLRSLAIAGSKAKALVYLVTIPIVVFAFGSWRNQQINELADAAPQVRIGVVQANIDPARDRSWEKRREIAKRHQLLSEKLVMTDNIDLLIWPESSVYYDYYVDDREIAPGSPRDPYPGRTVPLIFGGQLKVRGSGDIQYFNSALALSADGAVAGVYRKQVLLPFAEYHPFRGYLPLIDSMIDTEDLLAAGDNEPPLVVQTEKGSIRAAVGICYEDLIPTLYSASLTRFNPNLLISLINDAWFLESPAARQHLMLSIWRTIENRRALVRVTNNGVTAFIDPSGRVRSELAQFGEGAAVFDSVPLVEAESPLQMLTKLQLWWWIALLVFVIAVGLKANLFPLNSKDRSAK